MSTGCERKTLEDCSLNEVVLTVEDRHIADRVTDGLLQAHALRVVLALGEHLDLLQLLALVAVAVLLLLLGNVILAGGHLPRSLHRWRCRPRLRRLC